MLFCQRHVFVQLEVFQVTQFAHSFFKSILYGFISHIFGFRGGSCNSLFPLSSVPLISHLEALWGMLWGWRGLKGSLNCCLQFQLLGSCQLRCRRAPSAPLGLSSPAVLLLRVRIVCSPSQQAQRINACPSPFTIPKLLMHSRSGSYHLRGRCCSCQTSITLEN